MKACGRHSVMFDLGEQIAEYQLSCHVCRTKHIDYVLQRTTALYTLDLCCKAYKSRRAPHVRLHDDDMSFATRLFAGVD